MIVYRRSNIQGRYEITVDEFTPGQFNWQVRDLNLGSPVLIDGISDDKIQAQEDAYDALQVSILGVDPARR